MSTTIAAAPERRHRVIPDTANRMVKAEIRKPETREFWAEIGACLDEARRVVGWTLDQLAAELHRDPRQVRRWMAGEEQAQVATVWSVAALQQPFVIALAKRAQCLVTTRIEVRVA